jgi:hypothetical protein
MRLTLRFTLPAIIALTLLVAPAAHAWSNKEHLQLTRMAAEQLLARPDTPPAMKEWLLRGLGGRAMTMDEEKEYFMRARVGIITRGVDGLPYWATMPDMFALTDQRDRVVAPFGVGERLLHFIDCEFFNPDPNKRSYVHDLSHKPKVEDFPRDMKDERYAKAGMLPFRVEDCYGQLVAQIRANRLADQPGQYPRDEHAVRWAGMLAHYLEDNTQPQHATIDYQSRAYFANKVRAPNVHSEVEYKMGDDDRDDYMPLREEFWPILAKAVNEVQDPIQTTDLWRATLEVSLASYDALPLIGEAAMEAAKQGGTPAEPKGPFQAFDTNVFFHHKGQVRGREMTVMEMKAIQQAWAVRRVERVWLAAWDEAHTPQPATVPAGNTQAAPPVPVAPAVPGTASPAVAPAAPTRPPPPAPAGKP